MAFKVNKSKDTEDLEKKVREYDGGYTGTERSNAAYQRAQELTKGLSGDFYDGGIFGSGQYGTKRMAAAAQLAAVKPFEYDMNGDMLYQQYKDRYVNQGQQAMMDTMGQAQAMTGGYGNTYAQQAGQQAYQGYLQGLNDKIPDLYNLAMQKYQMDVDRLKDRYNLYDSLYQDGYAKWSDDYNRKADQADRARDDYRYEDNVGRSDYYDNRSYYADQLSDSRAYDFNLAEADQNQENIDREFGEKVRQFDEGMAFDREKYNEGVRQYNQENALAWAQLAQNASTGNTASGKGVSGVDSSVTDMISEDISYGYVQNNSDLLAELNGLIGDGVITKAQAEALYSAYNFETTAEAEPIMQMSRFRNMPSDTVNEIAKEIAKSQSDEKLRTYIYGDGSQANPGLLGSGTVTKAQADELYGYAILRTVKGLGDVPTQYTEDIVRAITVDNNDDLYMNLGDLVAVGILSEKQGEILYSAFAVKDKNATDGYGTGKDGGTNLYTEKKYSRK